MKLIGKMFLVICCVAAVSADNTVQYSEPPIITESIDEITKVLTWWDNYGAPWSEAELLLGLDESTSFNEHYTLAEVEEVKELFP